MLLKIPSKQPLVRYLQWDSDFFGLPVASLDGGHLRAENSKLFYGWCRQEKIRCLYFLANGTDAQTLQCAYDEGFKLVDVRVEMEFDLENWLQSKQTCLAIRPLTKKVELSSIQTLARKSQAIDLGIARKVHEHCLQLQEFRSDWQFQVLYSFRIPLLHNAQL